MHGSRSKIHSKNLVRQRCAKGINSCVKGLKQITVAGKIIFMVFHSYYYFLSYVAPKYFWSLFSTHWTKYSYKKLTQTSHMNSTISVSLSAPICRFYVKNYFESLWEVRTRSDNPQLQSGGDMEYSWAAAKHQVEQVTHIGTITSS
jgi:hypothetical protein